MFSRFTHVVTCGRTSLLRSSKTPLYVCVSPSNHCGKNTWDNQLLKRKDSLGSQVRRFQPMPGWPCCFGACGEPVPHGRSTWQRKLLMSWPPESKEGRRAQDPTSASRGTLPVTWLPSTKRHLLKVPPPSKCAIGQDQAFNAWALGDIPDQTTALDIPCFSVMDGHCCSECRRVGFPSSRWSQFLIA